jgi:hypothetical protein
MIKAEYGLAGFLLLAIGGLNGWPAHAQPASLQDVPLQTPPKISPWPESRPESADPQQEGTDPLATENTAATPAEDTDIASLDIDWSLLDVDAATLMTANPKQLRGGPRAAPVSGMIWSSQEKAYGSSV